MQRNGENVNSFSDGSSNVILPTTVCQMTVYLLRENMPCRVREEGLGGLVGSG